MRLARSLLLVASLAGANAAVALTVEQQSDQYLLEAQQAYKDGRFSGAYDAFKSIERLGVDMVDDFHFFYANAAFKTKNYDKAWQQINLYLEKTQRSGSYYTKALSLYQDIRPKVSQVVEKDIAAFDKKITEFEELAEKHNLSASQALRHKRQQKQQIQQLLDKNYFSKASQEAKKQTAKLGRQIEALEQSLEKRKTVANLMREYERHADFGLLSHEKYKAYEIRFSAYDSSYLKVLDFDEYDKVNHRLHLDISPDIRNARAQMGDIRQAKQSAAKAMKLALKCRSWKSEVEGLEEAGFKYGSSASRVRKKYQDNCGDKS